MKTKAERDLNNKLAKEFEIWWKREGRHILEDNLDNDDCETKGMASAFHEGARQQRKIDQQKPRRPLS